MTNQNQIRTMRADRRKFVKSVAKSRCLSATLPLSSNGEGQTSKRSAAYYFAFDKVLKKHFFKQELFPDLFYYGGMTHTMQVARMAEKTGLKITPHMSCGGLGFVHLLQMLSVCPATARFHEFKLFDTPDANGNIIRIETKGKPFTSNNGEIDMLTGPVLGISTDPDYINTHKVITD